MRYLPKVKCQLNNYITPLFKYIIDQDEYKLKYQSYLRQFVDEVFVPANVIQTYTSYYNLLKDYAYAEQTGYTYIMSDAYFDSAVEELKQHVQDRTDAVSSYLE